MSNVKPLENDLLNLWTQLPHKLRVTSEEARAAMAVIKGLGIKVPHMAPNGFAVSVLTFAVRDYAVDRWAWAVPNEEAIQMLVKHSPIVEIGAGTGYWARLAAQAGADVVAYDSRVGHNHGKGHQVRKCGAYFPVRRGGAGMARYHRDRTLFLCWPPYKSGMAAKALANYSGRTLIYVGENGGCTGDDAFHEALEAQWVLGSWVQIPQWMGIHDRMLVFNRKESG